MRIAFCLMNQGTTFPITDTKLYVPVVTLSTEDNEKLLQQPNQDSNLQLTNININQNMNVDSKLIF